MDRVSYYKMMYPYAKKAESATSVPYYFILAQWAYETGNGENRGAKELNNHAGLKYVSSSIALRKNGMYAEYTDLNQFVQDYSRVLNLSYYKKLKTANTLEELYQAITTSPYAETPYSRGFIDMMKQAIEVTEGVKVPDTPTSDSNKEHGGAGISFDKQVESMSEEELKKYAVIGVALMAFIALLK